MRKIIIILLSIFLLLNKTEVNSKSINDLIEDNPELSTFRDFLDETGLYNLLNQDLPWDWTIFAPSNDAFKKAPEKLKKDILSNKFFSQNLFMDHILAKNKTSRDINEMTTEVTISNKKVQLYKTNSLHVKDMIIIKEDLTAINGVIHIIDCIMFVQPSFQDGRLSEQLKEKYSLTSCCFQNKEEVALWKDNFENKY